MLLSLMGMYRGLVPGLTDVDGVPAASLRVYAEVHRVLGFARFLFPAKHPTIALCSKP